jgi:hypothetical protein
MTARARLPLVIRFPLWVRIYGYAFGALWVGILAVGFFGSDDFDPASVVFVVGFMAIGVAFVARMVRTAVIADDTTLLVRNFYRTKRFSWQEVEGFRTGRISFQPWGRMIFVLLRDGNMYGTDATMTTWGRAGRRDPDTMLADLRSWLPAPPGETTSRTVEP